MDLPRIGPPGDDAPWARLTGLLRVDGQVTHACTVGHTFPRGASRVVVHGDSTPLGTVELNLLDARERTDRHDFALIRLDDPPPWPGAHTVDDPGPRVRTSDGRVTGYRVGRHASFFSAIRNQRYSLARTLHVVPGRTRPGDSGVPLWHAEDPGCVVGMLIGKLGAASVYAPLRPILATLDRLTGQSWSVAASAASPSKSSFST